MAEIIEALRNFDKEAFLESTYSPESKVISVTTNGNTYQRLLPKDFETRGALRKTLARWHQPDEVKRYAPRGKESVYTMLKSNFHDTITDDHDLIMNLLHFWCLRGGSERHVEAFTKWALWYSNGRMWKGCMGVPPDYKYEQHQDDISGNRQRTNFPPELVNLILQAGIVSPRSDIITACARWLRNSVYVMQLFLGGGGVKGTRMGLRC